MAIPGDYFYRQGYYWKVDGTGPYQWDGVRMALIDYGVPAENTSTVQINSVVVQKQVATNV